MIRHLLTLSTCCTVAVTLAFAGSAIAQHSDIEFQYDGGKIDIEFGAEGQVFETDLPLTGSFEQVTDDPGFDSEELPNGLIPGDTIGFNILGPLVYHDGSSFASVPTGATIVIEDALSSILNVDDAFASGSGVIAEAFDAGGGRGDVHAHVDFALTPLSLDTPEYGAYGILMELTSDNSGVANSDPFYIVFNFGLAEPTFEGAVGDFASSVPEPGSALVLLAGAGLLAARRRR